MRVVKVVLVSLASAVAIFASLLGLYFYGMSRLGGTDGGQATPPEGRNRGELLKRLTYGQFLIEQRVYEAGKDSTTRKFCDYWISVRGKEIKLDELNMVNQYNSCGALLLVKARVPTFILGSYVNSGGEYVPIVVSEQYGVLSIDRREECAIYSGSEGSSQSYLGWKVENDKITLCGRTWTVLPF